MFLEDMLRQNPLQMTDPAPFREMIADFVRGTQFENNFQVNPAATTFVPGQLLFYFSSFADQKPWKPLAHTCFYYRTNGEANLILCDYEFLTQKHHAFSDKDHPTSALNVESTKEYNDLPAEHQRFERMFATYMQSAILNFFPFWVIGHEIGHAVLGHDGGNLRFDDDELTEISREDREKEVEADLFVISRLPADSRWSMDLFQMLTHLLNHWVTVETGVSAVTIGAKGYSGSKLSINDKSWTHPPMIVRILNLLDAYLRKYPDVDTTGYYNRVRSQIDIAR